MRYIYENRTESSKLVTLLSESKSSVSHIPMAAGARLELVYPGLDAYVPHWLTRVNESGHDISATVVSARELAESIKVANSKEDEKSDDKDTDKEPDKEAAAPKVKAPKAPRG